MLTLPKESEQNKVEDAIAQLEGSNLSYKLLIDDEDFSDKISSEQGEWGTDDSGVNYVDLVLTTALPRRLEGAPVKFSAVLNGAEVPQLVGVDSLSEIGEDRASTDPFQARSAGGLANENTLDEDVDINGWFPEQVVRKACTKLPYTRVKVDSLPNPVLYFTRAEDTYFKREQHPSEMLTAVQQKAPYMFLDTYTGGFVASASLFLNRGAPLRTYDADDIRGSGESDVSGWRPPVRTELRYSKVVVFRRNPDDSYAYESSSNVIYRGSSYPPRDRTFYVELEDPTGDGWRRAQSLARDLAEKFARGVYKDELVIPSLDPLLMRGDAFNVDDYARDSEASYQRRWLCWIESIKKEIQNPLPTLGYSAALVFEDRIDVPTLILGGISGGVTVTLSPFVNNVSGFYRESTLTASYVTNNSTGMFVDSAASGGNVSHGVTGFSFEL